MKSHNVRPILRSFKEMILYAGPIGAKLSTDAWQRFHSFFMGNRNFFRHGGSEELTDVLDFLRTFSSASPDPSFDAFYAGFLNELIGVVKGKVVGDDQELTSYIYDQLKLLYGKNLKDVLAFSSGSLQKFAQVEEFKSCLDLADVILGELTEEIVLNHKVRGTVSSLLRGTSMCGQRHFEKESPDGDRRLSEQGAIFLVASNRSVIEQYRRVTQILFDNEIISPKSVGTDGQIVKYYVFYNQALEAAAGL